MKTLLAIALTMLVYAVGFCSAPAHSAEPPKNAGNKDVPHAGDNMMLIDRVENVLILVIPSTVQKEKDGSVSIVVVIAARDADTEYPTVHRLSGRVRFDCAAGKHQNQQGYLINDDGDVVGTRPSDGLWKPTEEGTSAAEIADVVCGGSKIAHEKPPNTTEL